MNVIYFTAGMASMCLIVVMYELRSIGLNLRRAMERIDEEES